VTHLSFIAILDRLGGGREKKDKIEQAELFQDTQEAIVEGSVVLVQPPVSMTGRIAERRLPRKLIALHDKE